MKSRERIDKTSIQIDTVQISVAIFAKRKEFSSKLCRVYSNTILLTVTRQDSIYVIYNGTPIALAAPLWHRLPPRIVFRVTCSRLPLKRLNFDISVKEHTYFIHGISYYRYSLDIFITGYFLEKWWIIANLDGNFVWIRFSYFCK